MEAEQFPQEVKIDNSAMPENKSTPEKEPCGRNVEAEINLIRHGKREKDKTWKSAPLTLEGFLECVKLGRSRKIKGSIICGASPADRTRETAQEILDYSPTENKKLVISEELASKSSPEFIKTVEKHVIDKYNGDPPKNQELCCTVPGIDFYLSFGDKRPDEQTYSPVEAAANVALVLNEIVSNIDNTPSGTSIDSFFVSHDYVIAAFLQQVIIQELESGDKKTGFSSLSELGNSPIAFLEGPQIIVKNDEQGKQTTKLIFRGKTYAMDMERFNELVKIGEVLKKERVKNKILSGKNLLP